MLRLRIVRGTHARSWSKLENLTQFSLPSREIHPKKAFPFEGKVVRTCMFQAYALARTRRPRRYLAFDPATLHDCAMGHFISDDWRVFSHIDLFTGSLWSDGIRVVLSSSLHTGTPGNRYDSFLSFSAEDPSTHIPRNGPTKFRGIPRPTHAGSFIWTSTKAQWSNYRTLKSSSLRFHRGT